MKNQAPLLAGLDIGSTTVKLVLAEAESTEIRFSDYRRHNAEQLRTAAEMTAAAAALFPGRPWLLAVCGSGGQLASQAADAPFVQEVVANAIAIRNRHPQASVAIELGGQDAKVIFFTQDKASGQLIASDMRMNGSCAGGTGAFIDQVAELLHIRTEEFNAYAQAGRTVYDISGRCGVFAKTDIQPLLNQGVSKADIALSTFHAIAKQTIGGLAQGLTIKAPVIFEGGPLTFNSALVRVFSERLGLVDDEAILPEQSEILVAWGAALARTSLFADDKRTHDPEMLSQMLTAATSRAAASASAFLPLFVNADDRSSFESRHNAQPFSPPVYPRGTTLPVYLGIDAGSTTSKFVLLDENSQVVNIFYSSNKADPLGVIKAALIDTRDRYRAAGVELQIRGAGCTGYGERLFAAAFHADLHSVETVAHARAARHYEPEATFVLDIGGQDMKAIQLGDGIITAITLNEACSAGCGSFIETYARSLGVPVDQIAPLAFASKKPSRLGSRCTVFMNSSIITEQKSGKTPRDILAGICISIIENVFTKVVRIPNLAVLGPRIVVQGGTFRNDAVLRAMELYTGAKVTRPPHPGEMGAIGIALLVREMVARKEHSGQPYHSTFIPLDELEDFEARSEPGVTCRFCTNHCQRTVVSFSHGGSFVTGNRCERGLVLGDPSQPDVARQAASAHKRMSQVPDLIKLHENSLTADYHAPLLCAKREQTIGLPRTFEFWESMPYWKTLFTCLGFSVRISKKSNYSMFESALAGVPSDTVCFPAKLAHGHVKDLIEHKVDRIFMPMMIRVPRSNQTAQGEEMCPVVQGYPMVIEKSDEPLARHGVPLDHPTFHWYNRRLKWNQTAEYLFSTFGIPASLSRAAINHAEKALSAFNKTMLGATREALRFLQTGKKTAENTPLQDTSKPEFAVIVSGRPYHSDSLVNHNLSGFFTSQGIPVLALQFLPGLRLTDLRKSRIDSFNPYHSRMLEAALFASRHPDIELVQVVSFGCGHDAIISDEMQRILKKSSGKELLILKLDEGEAAGPLSIRINSFIETIRQKRALRLGNPQTKAYHEPGKPYDVVYRNSMKKTKTVFVPNLSPAFTRLSTRIFEAMGYRMRPLGIADARAIELGKKYVHNDICFPAQINIGEILRAIEDGECKPDEVVAALAKNCVACRAGHYAALCRKALDDAGYPQIPIITTGEDTKAMHPGFKAGLRFKLQMLWGMPAVDAMEQMRRRIRVYERFPGQTERVFAHHLEKLSAAVTRGWKASLKALDEAIDDFNAIPVIDMPRKPRVGIVGEILMNYHPGSNSNVESYLEQNGMEVLLPGMTDFFRKKNIAEKEMAKRGLHPLPLLLRLKADGLELAFSLAHGRVAKRMRRFRFFEHSYSIKEIAETMRGHIDHSYHIGEGWLMPGEISMMAGHGVNSFVILNPFGCMPNHITGRGMIKTLKALHPQIQILALDYDPDTSFANIENRLQMLIMNARDLEKQGGEAANLHQHADTRSGQNA